MTTRGRQSYRGEVEEWELNMREPVQHGTAAWTVTEAASPCGGGEVENDRWMERLLRAAVDAALRHVVHAVLMGPEVLQLDPNYALVYQNRPPTASHTLCPPGETRCPDPPSTQLQRKQHLLGNAATILEDFRSNLQLGQAVVYVRAFRIRRHLSLARR
jgi:hypothetical protein